MGNHKRKSKGKTIRPTFFIFCEGESEDVYVSFLRAHYRVSIQIITKISRNRISQKYINKALDSLPRHTKDKLFLLYDIDAPGMLDKLQSINNAILLTSNPCFELWYILHYKNQTAAITTRQCINKITVLCLNYKKGFICDKLRAKLLKDTTRAVARARKLTLYQNPSTSIYILIDELNSLL